MKICCELDQSFDDIDKKQSYHTSNDKVDFSCKNIVVIDKKWFDDRNLTDGANFPAALIKCAKTRAKQNPE